MHPIGDTQVKVVPEPRRKSKVISLAYLDVSFRKMPVEEDGDPLITASQT